MIYEMTIQIRVTNFNEGVNWYKTLLQKNPDFVPHEGFVEWELLPNCWLQVAEGEPANGSGPIRLGVANMDAERNRLINELVIEEFEIFSREEVPVKWATFADPWGNRIGLFEYINEEEKRNKIASVKK